MKGKDLLLIFIVGVVYLSFLFILKKHVLSYRFDEKLINRYFLSQDIPYEPKGKRLFLSDGEIYSAAGYLYAKGSDPTLYNFDHPPLIKYLFGYSILLFKTPYVVQIVFALVTIFLTYYLSLNIFRSFSTSFFASLFLAVDPLFIDLSSQPLLDLGETVFLLFYAISVLFFKQNVLFQGISLGLFAGSKSLVSPLFFVLVFAFYQWHKKEFILKKFVLHLMIAFMIFSLLYLKTFIIQKGMFNIFFFMLKTVKYRIQHSITSFPGASLLLFLTGVFQTWWGERGFLREKVWTIFWPLSFIIMSTKIIHVWRRKKITSKDLFAILPFLYLFYLGIQSPFVRYFMIILPFVYITFSSFLFEKFTKLLQKSY